MTDEELAEEWLQDNLHVTEEDYKLAFLAGLKAGRPQWHNIQKDPGDLPPSGTEVLNENGDKVVYTTGQGWTAYSEYYEKYVEVDKPVAWSFVPKYNSIAWNAYLLYLKDWVKDHAGPEHFGSSPACFDEWQDNEDEEEEVEK